MSEEKVPEEMPDAELPPVEPFNEPPVESPIAVTPRPVEPFSEPLAEAPAGAAPPPAPPPAEPVKSWPAPSAAASDNKLWALLSYVLSPVVPVIILLMEEKKNQPDLKPHTMQALVAGVAIIVVTMILGVIPVIGCLSPIVALVGWIAMIYWGFQAYNGKEVTIPVVTNLVKSQGWA
jgi:uncharacterized protein